HPDRSRWSLWLLMPVLVLADLSNTALSALLTFSDRVLYPYYSEVPRLGGISAMEDQSAAGVLMWVPGSIAFLLPLFGIGIRLLSGQAPKRRSQRAEVRGQERRLAPTQISLPLVHSSLTSDSRLLPSVSGLPPRSSAFDLLRLPLLGTFLKWRHARIS